MSYSRCVTEFIPDISDEKELLVVEGLITDQPEEYTITVSKSLPIGLKNEARPVSGCTVTVSDNMGNSYRFLERDSGIYVSPPEFTGMVGRTYKLHITTPSSSGFLNYDSEPAEMLSIPSLSLYYEKVKLFDAEPDLFDKEGCQIYLNTFGSNNYYRWEYFETWILRLPFSVPNQTCWVSDRSRNILIKNNVDFGGVPIIRQPFLYISNSTDRLKTRYSILVNQYSINEDEYNFWAALQTLTEQSGGLYDIIPGSIPSNIRCIENPDETVLGYFSVSAKASKRIFIDNEFAGIIDLYKNCITDTIFGDGDIRGIDTSVWVLFDKPKMFPNPRTRILTRTKGCYDCTVRGTTTRPSFWIDE
ncbi:MAG TPA: DUF4249 domain-containing protein [Bacteroidales bacterium]|jgi:hypothetical protein|nr:DUF4249 domain-containing protein [Bacteroidales bacterium]